MRCHNMRLSLSLGATATVMMLFAGVAGAAQLPGIGTKQGSIAPSHVTQAQYGVYFGYGRSYGGGGYYGPGYRPYYGGYARPYYDAPPPVTYYETRPYVARPAGPSYDDDAVARCASRFRSFNPRSGTYVTYEGEERLCPYLR